MNREWIDFKKVKEAIGIEMVLEHYGIKLSVNSGDELRGACPIHKGSPRSKNFTVNVRRNAFKCFSSECGARGNILDFVAAMESCSVRDAALKLQEWFKIGESQQTSLQGSQICGEAREVSRGIYSGEEGELFEVITTAKSAEDFEPLVVYRELFGNYEFWVAPVENFGTRVKSSAAIPFTLVKAL